MSELSERLRETAAQLVTAREHASYAGSGAGVRVKDVSSLLTDLTEAASRIEELEAHNRRLGQGGAERYWENRYRDEVARAEKAERAVAEALSLIKLLTILAEDTTASLKKHGSPMAVQMEKLASADRQFVKSQEGK